MEQKNIRQALTVADILALTLIFFGFAIVSSNMIFFENNAAPVEQSALVGVHEWASIGAELGWLLLAFWYLRWRRFDWRLLDFSVNKQSAWQAFKYFLIAGTVATVCDYALAWGQYLFLPQSAWEMGADVAQQGAALAQANEAWVSPLSQLSLSFVLFALLNGFFEELYFLGLVFAVAERNRKAMIMFSLLVRFSFHTYQGIDAAVVITTLGVSFALLRQKNRQLLPFMWAHSAFDMLGLGLPLWLLWA